MTDAWRLRVLREDGIWVSRENAHRISEMTDEHICNSIDAINRWYNDDEHWEMCKILEGELRRRKHAKYQDEQHVILQKQKKWEQLYYAEVEKYNALAERCRTIERGHEKQFEYIIELEGKLNQLSAILNK